MTITYHAGRRIQGLSTDIVETPTFSDDFSSYADQASADASWIPNDTAKCRVNITNDNLDFNSVGDNSNDAISYNLASVSDTAWVMRFRYHLTSFSTGSGMHITLGLSSLPSSTAQNGTQNSITCQLDAGDALLCIDGTNAGGIASGGSGDATTAFTFVAGTSYYVELIRLTSTTAKVNVYSNSTFTTLVATASATIPNVTGLQYIKFTNRLVSASGSTVGTIDDIKFYNGVSSLTSKPTNVQAGSRFEETDTRKIYNLSKVHTFLLADTGTSFTPSASGTVEYLVIGGGGGGGALEGAGGGAGGYRNGTLAVTTQAYTITVGDGGAGGNNGGSNGVKGNDSIFSSITSTGGGYGATSGGGSFAGGSGGSGGGGAGGGAGGISSPVTSPVQGYAGGGSASGGNYPAGGGAGSSAVGGTGSGSVAGSGGNGTASSITGSSITRAGGGGGATFSGGTAGTGGSGGGGNGGGTPVAGTVNTGSGGGGAWNNGTTPNGGIGGSGIVIIKYSSGVNATGGTITTVWTEEV